MKTINVHRLQLRFETSHLAAAHRDDQARHVVSAINDLLQRELPDLGAEIIMHRDEVEVEEAESEA